jgi:hypothetical protein
MNCPKCGGLLEEIDAGWLKCLICSRPIRRSALATALAAPELNETREEGPMAKAEDKCPVKYCRNDAATCEKHAEGGHYETLCGARAEAARA